MFPYISVIGSNATLDEYVVLFNTINLLILDYN